MDYTHQSYIKGRRTSKNAGLTMVELLRHQARLAPDTAAVVHKNFSMTYREFDQLTDLLAEELIRLGLDRGGRVGILTDRNELVPLSVFGVMKAASIYVPLNPDLPLHRLNYLIEDAGIEYVLADTGLEDRIPGFTGTIVNAREFLCSRKITPLRESPDAPLSIAPPSPEDIMAVIYTTGSTGNPKGVMIKHKNGIDITAYYKRLIRLLPGEAVSSYVSLSFVLHTSDLFPTFMAGATLHIIGNDIRLDTGMFNAYLEANHIVTAVLPSGFGRRFIMQEKNHSLRALAMGGEGFIPLPELSRDYRIYNGYGCTECCGGITLGEVKPGDTHITAGIPKDNVDLYVVDEQGKIVPRGEKGELWVAGPAVSAGYLNQPGKTAEVFIQNPFSKESGFERIYKTGDLARVTEEGKIEITGRVDFQIKIRGYRIEPNEIDSCIREYPGVRESVTIAVEGAFSVKYLVAYIAADKKIDPRSLREFISAFLPPYMVPRFIEQLPKLPRNLNGKVDRAALPSPSFTDMAYIAPETETEQKLAQLWGHILGLDKQQIGRETDFFELGGDSLRATMLAFEIRRLFETNLSPVELLQSSILKEQAALITAPQAFNTIHAFSDTGDKTPMFFVHGGNIGPEAFAPLAGKLPGDRAFYCFENYNIYHPTERIRGITLLAEKYIEFLKTRVPQGPYILGGWSYGGLVAFETALQLERRGETVEHLYLLDPTLIRSPEEKQLREQLQDVNNYREYLSKDPLFERFRKLGLLDVLIENNRAVALDILNYTPNAVYQGEATLFKATKADSIPSAASPEIAEAMRRLRVIVKEKQSNGFSDYAPNLRIIEIPEIHDGFMRGEALDKIAEVIGHT